MDISVQHNGGDTYTVALSGDEGKSSHDVTVAHEALQRYAPGATAEDLLRESFAFLLEREPPSSILRTFTIETIEHYFPEYPEEIRRRLGA